MPPPPLETTQTRRSSIVSASTTQAEQAPLRALLTDRWLPAIVLLALALRLLVRWLAPHADWLGDEREYYSAAAILADGRGLAFFDQSIWLRPPLYIAGLAILFRFFGTTVGVEATWLVQVGLSLATVVLAYLLSRLWHGRPAVARVAALLCAIYLPFAVYTRLLLSETAFTFLIVLAFVALSWHARHSGWGTLILAGAAFGCAILTRGIALPFLAAIPLWALAVRQRGRTLDWRGAIVRSAIVIGVAVLIVAPWTARNALAYGRLIPVDTTGGYNFWLGALQGQNTGQIDATLREIPNHGDRQAVAWTRGWEVVRADPLSYLGKSAREAFDLWRINFGAFERLTRGYGLGRVPVPWLGLTFALDDLLYLIALPLAALGWVNTGRREDRRLLLLWLGWNCVTGALFFAITRFRLPLMPFIFLLAARGAFSLPPLLRGALGNGFRLPRPWFLPATAAALILALVLPSFTPGQYLVGAERAASANRLDQGYALLARGRVAEAEAIFAALPGDYPFRPTGLAAAYHARGQDERALATLDDDLDGLGSTLLRGEIFRARGERDAAQQALNYREVRVANPTAEAWAHLNPEPVARLDVGDGLDLGYLRGLNLDEREGETTFRWTTARADFRLAAPTYPGATVRIRLRGYRPAGAISPVTVQIGGREIGTVTPTSDWQIVEFPIGTAQPDDGWLVVQLETPTFVLSYADQREFGAMVDWIEVK
jgi:4-amino-4-deoxy-L-arabinose transferase-like glycosyltransferase